MAKSTAVLHNPKTNKSYRLVHKGFTLTKRIKPDCVKGSSPREHERCGFSPQKLWELGGFDKEFVLSNCCLCECHFE